MIFKVPSNPNHSVIRTVVTVQGGNITFLKNGKWWEMPWLPIKWMYLLFGVYMADERSALHQCCVLPRFFKGPWEAFTASEVTLARSCVTLCPAQHSCSSCHFLPLTTWLWLWTAGAFCISQMTDVLNVFICEGFYCVLWICTRARGFLFCVITCWFVALFYFLFHPPPPLCSTWKIKLNLT